ncbi:MAG: hypothetical protein ACRDZ2_04670 [Ilumatobacteraceae bacterium]
MTNRRPVYDRLGPGGQGLSRRDVLKLASLAAAGAVSASAVAGCAAVPGKPDPNAPQNTYSIGMVAGIGFLGFSTNPGAADWGQMINENRLALLVEPWGVLAPVVMIGIFAVGTNLMADGITQLAAKGEDQ